MQKQNDEHGFLFPAESNFEKHNASHPISAPVKISQPNPAEYLSIHAKDAEVFLWQK